MLPHDGSPTGRRAGFTPGATEPCDDAAVSDRHLPRRPPSPNGEPGDEPGTAGGRIGSPAVPAVVRRPLAAAAVVTGIAAVVLGMVVAGGSAGLPVDVGLRAAVAAWWGEPGRLALLIDLLGEPRVVAVVVVALVAGCLVLGRRRLAVVAILGPALAVVLTTALKPLVGRTINGDNLAYPSGHATSSAALALVAALLVVSVIDAGLVGASLLVVAAPVVAGGTMALAQIALNAHYVTDTLGGLCVALAAVVAVAFVVDRAAGRWARRAVE